MYTVDQILAPDFVHSWQEAVAVVQEVAVALGTVSTVPDAEDLFLEEDGSVALGFASEASEDPVSRLAGLLQRLLDGTSAPPELSSLASDNARMPPAHSSVAGFTSALAFYERPDRRSDVRAVVGRMASRRAAAHADSEIERLRERIASAPDAGEQETASTVPAVAMSDRVVDAWRRLVPPMHRVPKLSSGHAAAGAAIVVALLAVFAGVKLVPSSVRAAAAPEAAAVPAPKLPEAPATADVAAPETADTAKAMPAGGVGNAAAAAKKLPAPPIIRAPKAAARALVATRQPVVPKQALAPSAASVMNAASAVSSTPAVVPAPEAAGVVPFAPSLPPPRAALPTATRGTIVPRSASEARARPVPVSEDDDAGVVYSAAERNVTPPRLMRAQLPQRPVAGADTGYFDMVVDEAGDVEIVRLTSPKNRYQDRMLVAAAKAWKFKPALLDGTPVKYRLRIPVIVQEED
jgi:hypothetical protein